MFTERLKLMKQGVINNKKLLELFKHVSQTAIVYAPQKLSSNEEVEILPFSEKTQLAFDYVNVVMPPKRIFFPDTEVLCVFRDNQIVEPEINKRDIVVFGIRPCDARALQYLDKIFCEFGNTKDIPYIQRRQRSTVISLACTSPADTCFCTSLGGSPAGREGCDIIATAFGEKILFEACDSHGETFMENFAGYFNSPTQQDIESCKEIAEKSKKQVENNSTYKLEPIKWDAFDSDVWKSVSEICLGCGICTLLCPTCHCFDITDERKGAVACRIRSWDTCQYPMFTQHASGHNPRPSRKERVRQRILHKFLYTVENLDSIFCVGCGRCITKCPVGIDIRDILMRLGAKGEV